MTVPLKSHKITIKTPWKDPKKTLKTAGRMIRHGQPKLVAKVQVEAWLCGKSPWQHWNIHGNIDLPSGKLT
jgi:hypothetical protein